MTFEAATESAVEREPTEPRGTASELPAWLWLGFPPALFALQLGVLFFGDRELYLRWFESEQGLVENGTAVVLTVGIVAGLLALRYRRHLPHPLLGGWLLLFVAGSLYFAGEELSWGQHWFGWGTPEAIGSVNDQGETNIHNVSSWFDQKPRLALALWVFVAGVGYPLWAMWRGSVPDPRKDWRVWIFPTFVCFPAAALAIAVRIPEWVAGWFGHPEWQIVRFAEPQEYLFAVFLTLYLLSFHLRLKRLAEWNRGDAGPARPASGGATRRRRQAT